MEWFGVCVPYSRHSAVKLYGGACGFLSSPSDRFPGLISDSEGWVTRRHTHFPQIRPSRQSTPNRPAIKQVWQRLRGKRLAYICTMCIDTNSPSLPGYQHEAGSGPSPSLLAEIWHSTIDIGGIQPDTFPSPAWTHLCPMSLTRVLGDTGSQHQVSRLTVCSVEHTISKSYTFRSLEEGA
jgi:hypothetical protein